LLNRRKDIYLERGNPLRHKIRNLVADWKTYSREKYLSKVVIPYIIQRVEEPLEEKDDDSINTATYLPAADEERNNTTAETNYCTDEEQDFSFNIIEPASNPKTKKKSRPDIPISIKKPRSSTTSHPKKTLNNMANELGKTLVVKMPDNGMYFAIVWVDSKLTNLEFVVSEDGCSVIQRSKTPQPASASTLLSHCSWAKDPFHVVVNSVNAELKTLKEKAQTKLKDQWTNHEIITLDEEVLRAFVDIRGNPTNSIGYNSDADGRQIITFFLKTMEAHRTVPSKGKFTNSNTQTSNDATGDNGSRTGMDVGDEDDVSDCFEESVQDVKSEMDEKFNSFAEQMKTMMGAFQQMQQQQQQFQSQVHQHYQSQQAQLAGHGNAGNGLHGAVPDNVASHGGQQAEY